MAIRLRTHEGGRVALCAATHEAQDGDLYLDDADHVALSEKFAMEARLLDNREYQAVMLRAMNAEGVATVCDGQGS